MARSGAAAGRRAWALALEARASARSVNAEDSRIRRPRPVTDPNGRGSQKVTSSRSPKAAAEILGESGAGA